MTGAARKNASTAGNTVFTINFLVLKRLKVLVGQAGSAGMGRRPTDVSRHGSENA
jgi:hypothetical protein